MWTVTGGFESIWKGTAVNIRYKDCIIHLLRSFSNEDNGPDEPLIIKEYMYVLPFSNQFIPNNYTYLKHITYRKFYTYCQMTISDFHRLQFWDKLSLNLHQRKHLRNLQNSFFNWLNERICCSYHAEHNW